MPIAQKETFQSRQRNWIHTNNYICGNFSGSWMAHEHWDVPHIKVFNATKGANDYSVLVTSKFMSQKSHWSKFYTRITSH